MAAAIAGLPPVPPDAAAQPNVVAPPNVAAPPKAAAPPNVVAPPNVAAPPDAATVMTGVAKQKAPARRRSLFPLGIGAKLKAAAKEHAASFPALAKPAQAKAKAMNLPPVPPKQSQSSSSSSTHPPIGGKG